MRWFAYSLFVVCLALGPSGYPAAAQGASSYDALIQQGKAQLQAGEAGQALATGEQAIKSDASRWEGYALAGGALMNLKRYEEAADRFSKAIELAPQDKQSALRELRRQCFAAESGTAPTSQPSTATKPGAAEATTTQAEIVLWKSIENSKNPDDFIGYLRQYPKGAFVSLAKARLSKLEGPKDITYLLRISPDEEDVKPDPAQIRGLQNSVVKCGGQSDVSSSRTDDQSLSIALNCIRNILQSQQPFVTLRTSKNASSRGESTFQFTDEFKNPQIDSESCSVRYTSIESLDDPKESAREKKRDKLPIVSSSDVSISLTQLGGVSVLTEFGLCKQNAAFMEEEDPSLSRGRKVNMEDCRITPNSLVVVEQSPDKLKFLFDSGDNDTVNTFASALAWSASLCKSRF